MHIFHCIEQPPTRHLYTHTPTLLNTTRCPTPCARQVKDKWGFRMTARYDMYAAQLAAYTSHDYKPQVIKDPSL